MKPAFQLEVSEAGTRWIEFSRGATIRGGTMAKAQGAKEWRLLYSPFGSSEWLVLDSQGRIIQSNRFDDLGPFVGRMPAAIQIVGTDSRGVAYLDGDRIALESGLSGTRYLTGETSEFRLSGTVEPGGVKVTLFGRSSDVMPASLLPLAAAGALAASSNRGPAPDPVPEPCTLIGSAVAFSVWVRKKVTFRRDR
ncbi:MAG: hypothetical protein AB7F50_04655 [Fimbriimonadaceae bacterium]